MKKLSWERPVAQVQRFEANEYVAACYRIKCTTPNGNATYYRLYEDSNNNGRLDNSDRLVYSYYRGFAGCNNWHGGVIRDDAPKANGFVTDNNGRNARHIFYWKESFGGKTVDWHVMTPGAQTYEQRPNAS